MPDRRNPNPEFTYDPLNAREFKRRMEEGFSPVYLTSISIIQGVALGLLGQQLFAVNQQSSSIPGDGMLTILYTITSFVVIVGLSYEYNWLVGIHRWPQKFIDTLLPFVIGFWEIAAIFNIANPQSWWLFISIFNLFGALAAFNTWRNCKPKMFADRKLFIFFKSSIFKSILLALSAAGYCFLVFLTYATLKSGLPWYVVDLPTSAIYIVTFALLLWKDQKFVDRVHEMLSLPT